MGSKTLTILYSVFHYSDPNFHYESGSGPPIARRSRSPGPPWVPSVIAPDQSGHGHVHQSLDQVGDLLEAYEVQESSYNLETPAIYPLPVEDMSYPHIDQHPSYPPQATPFQDPGSSTNVAYSVGTPPISRVTFTDAFIWCLGQYWF